MTTNPCSRNYPNNFLRGICVLFDADQVTANRQCAEGARLRNRLGTFRGFTTFEGCRGLESQTKCEQVGWDNSQLIPCCQGEINTSNACAPDWCPGTAACSNALEQFCTENNGENITTSGCQAICSNPPTDRARTWCDDASVAFCSQTENLTDSYCGCINASNNGLPPALSCFSPLCGSESYRTRGVERDVRE